LTTVRLELEKLSVASVLSKLTVAETPTFTLGVGLGVAVGVASTVAVALVVSVAEEVSVRPSSAPVQEARLKLIQASAQKR
jgi:hypothetical protein